MHVCGCKPTSLAVWGPLCFALTSCIGLGEVERSWAVGGAGGEAEAHGGLTCLHLQKRRRTRAVLVIAV